MTTRQELTEAVGERYRRSDQNEKRQILDEFVELTGYHRKHAIRVLCREFQRYGLARRDAITMRCAPR